MTEINLGLQSPGAPSGLLEAMLEACDGADRGGGIFAWMTVEGARLFLEAETFEAFARESAFRLVIGVDAITDVPALQALEGAIERLDGLTARALLHELRPVLFHPKLSWFVQGGQLTLITGSGNLTRGGLRTNWEAFTVVVAEGDDAARMEAQLDGWLEDWDDALLELADPRVLARARSNAGRERELKRRVRRQDAGREVRGGEGAEPAHGEEQVLVATIGRGRRWTQANFPRRFYEGFFRARVGTKRHILFQPVATDGSLKELQSRESVEVESENYRFELTAVAGGAYPTGSEAPIGVFVHARDGVFRYLVMMPDDDDYDTIADFLTTEWDGPAHELPRVLTSVNVLRAKWPGSPLWRTGT